MFVYFCRRDSFITHRAFCDALAHESSRQPQLPTLITNTSINNSQLFGNISNNNISLALSQIPPQQISSTHDQNDTNQATEILRFGNHNILSPPPQHALHTPPFSFITQQPNRNFQHDQHSQTFQGLISLSELNNHNLFSENFNHEAFFSENPLMCGPNINNQTSPISPHMSATALLQKASQMGATSSTNNINNNTASSLLRSYGSSSSSSVATKAIGGGSDGLTRDFLGVGQIVMRNMNGEGVSQREQRNFNVEAKKNAANFGGNFE